MGVRLVTVIVRNGGVCETMCEDDDYVRPEVFDGVKGGYLTEVVGIVGGLAFAGDVMP